jgi:predicted RNase H-like HicB family nuclease
MKPDSEKLPGEVPVYNCLVLLSPPDAEGYLAARCSNLPKVTARGKSRREVLAKVVAAFKAAVARYAGEGRAIPWGAEPLEPAPGEEQLWIAVHL